MTQRVFLPYHCFANKDPFFLILDTETLSAIFFALNTNSLKILSIWLAHNVLALSYRGNSDCLVDIILNATLKVFFLDLVI